MTVFRRMLQPSPLKSGASAPAKSPGRLYFGLTIPPCAGGPSGPPVLRVPRRDHTPTRRSDSELEAVGDTPRAHHEMRCRTRPACLDCRTFEQVKPAIEMRSLHRKRDMGLHRLPVIAARHQRDRGPERGRVRRPDPRGGGDDRGPRGARGVPSQDPAAQPAEDQGRAAAGRLSTTAPSR